MCRYKLISATACAAMLLAAAVIVFTAPTASAEDKETGIPPAMLYEGYLADSNGDPLPDGKYDFTFALYTRATGGEPIWTEDHKNLVLEKGKFRALLGAGPAPVPLDLPFDRPYFLSMRVEGGPELVPRLELATSAYAFRAREAESVADGSITEEKLAPNSVTNEKIESVAWEKITGVPESDFEGLSLLPKNTKPAVPAHTWHITGNLRTNPSYHYFGTADSTDLSFRTNAIERMRIYSYGKIAMKGDLDVEGYVTSRKTSTEGGFLLCDPDHGLKRSGGDDVHLYTTGGNILLEGGDVGIGTQTPDAGLHIDASAIPVPLRVSNGTVDRMTVDDAGRVRIFSSADGQQGDLSSYPLTVSGRKQGIAISVSENADSDNNFVSFIDPRGFRGRIEGQSSADVFKDPEYDLMTAIDVIEITVAGIELAGAASSANGCAGFGVVACPPIPSLIAAATASLAAQVARTAITQGFFWDNLGVAYESGSADYAEWLERAEISEVMEPGDIVGVTGGRISKSTSGAHKIMVVSRAPIVLGNMPEPEDEDKYEKVAFLGQVPVKVAGSVRVGDYIIPSGLGDGTGVAVAPELMTAEEFMKVVGRAWEASDSRLMKYITVAVGLDSGDIALVVRKQQREIDILRREVRALAGMIDEVESGKAYGSAFTGERAAVPASDIR